MNDDLKDRIRKEVLAEFDYSGEISDEALLDAIDERIIRLAQSTFCPLAEREKLKKSIFSSIRGFDVLDELLTDENITEIMVNGENTIFYEKAGKLKAWDKSFASRDKLNDIIQQIAAVSNRVVNEADPVADARLPDGSRVSIVLPPVALDGPVLTIRKFSKEPLTMEKLISFGAISKEAAAALETFVKAKFSIFICGGTGSGKTTFLNALSGFIPKNERVITIEDSAELKIEGVKNLVRMETRNKNSEDCKAIAIRDLIKAALRMRPDRIVVGEIRGEEAVDMLAAMNTGHEGSLSTGHANSARDMLMRIATMVIMGMDIPMNSVKQQINSAIDLIVFVSRMRDGSRRVMEISELAGIENNEIVLNKLFEFKEDENSTKNKVSGALLRTKNHLINQEKLLRMGLQWE